MRIEILDFKNRVGDWLVKLSLRERLILGGAAAFLIPFVIYQSIILPIEGIFANQTATLAKLQEDYKTVPFILDRYNRFHARKDQIQSEFKEVDIKEGEQSLLENILSGKVDAGFDIAPGTKRAFAGSYEQANFNVRFTTQSIASVVDVLTEISTGKKRMLITSVSISKDPNGEKLRIELGVSSIRQLKV